MKTVKIRGCVKADVDGNYKAIAWRFHDLGETTDSDLEEDEE